MLAGVDFFGKHTSANGLTCNEVMLGKLTYYYWVGMSAGLLGLHRSP